MASIGLPAAIEATVQSVGLPDSVWAKVEEIKNSGGVDALESILTQNQTTGMNVRARLDEVEATLKKEEEEDVCGEVIVMALRMLVNFGRICLRARLQTPIYVPTSDGTLAS